MVHKRPHSGAEPEHDAFLRAPFSGTVHFWSGPPGLEPALGQARELSVGGLFMESDALLTEGAHATLRFSVAAHVITVSAEVVRVEKGGMLHAAGMGLRFLDLSADDSRLVVDYVVGHGARRPA